MRLKKIIIYSLLVLCLPIAGLSQGSGFDILVTGPNARALGMNGTVTATALGASSIYTNPANLNLEQSSSISADYSLWIAGLRNSHFAANFKKQHSAIAVGILNSQADDFQLRNSPQPSQGTFSVSYLSIAGAYAYQINNFSAGVTAQYLREQFLINDASGYAFNAGLSSQWFDNILTLSTAIRNLGELSKLNQQSTSLPTEWRMGASTHFMVFDSPSENSLPVELMLAADYVYPINDDHSNTSNTFIDSSAFFTLSLGVTLANTLDIYSGYRSEKSERPFSFGTSLNLENIGVSYAFIPFNTGFGNAHSIGLSYNF
ncbi:MAG: PorV/PorQ family protein [Balneolaceae bacterium]|nr:PorV/PorQ family protein [Balneolaceae bacterium]